MNSNYLYKTEQEVIHESNKEFGVGKFKVEKAIELLFNISHFLKEEVELDSDEHVFHSFAYYNYLKLPYTLRSIIVLWEMGYYLESNILIRSILEGLLQIKYFYKNKELINNHLLNKKRISFYIMFEDLLPNLYDRYYGKLLSSFAHSKLITSIFREERESPENSEIIHGCKFNQTYARFSITQAISLAYGHLNFTDISFPFFNSKIDNDLKNRLKSFLAETKENLSTIFEPENDDNFRKPFFEFIDNRMVNT